MPDNKKSLGEIAYDGYRDHTGGKTWNGYDMPHWADLGEHVRSAWEAGAKAAQRQVLNTVVGLMEQAIAEQEAEKQAAVGA